MKKRTLIRIISYFLALLIVLSGVIFGCYKEMKFYKQQVKYTHSSALQELRSSLNNINLNLEKAAYSTTEKQMNNIALMLYTEAKIAKNAFSQLAAQGLNGENFNKFLSQVGNYAVHCARKIANSEEIADNERENIIKLGEISSDLSKSLSEIEVKYNNNGVWDEEVSNNINSTLEESALTVAFLELEEGFTDYPTLIYDGPYSEYLTAATPEMMTNAVVDLETAKRVAAKDFGIDENALKFDGNESGKIPCYRFVFDQGVIGVSQNGGYVVYYRKYTTEEKAMYNYEQAVSIAQKFLKRTTQESFLPTYYYADNGVCTVNFAYLNGSVICYTDLVKLGVDLSNGEVVFYEGRGYLTNHKQRTLPTPKFPIEEAEEIVSGALKINSRAITLIPTDGGYEKQCYEFMCTGQKNEKVLVYINTQTLEEEDILMLIETDGGTLVK